MLERLTFALGLVVTALGWLIATVHADVASSLVIRYETAILRKSLTERVFEVDLLNLSASKAATGTLVGFYLDHVNSKECKLEKKMLATKPIIEELFDAKPIDEPKIPSMTRFAKFASVRIENLGPSEAVGIGVSYSGACAISLKFNSNISAGEGVPKILSGSEQARFISSGIEACLAEHRIGILLSLIVAFAAGAGLLLGASFWMSRERKPQIIRH